MFREVTTDVSAVYLRIRAKERTCGLVKLANSLRKYKIFLWTSILSIKLSKKFTGEIEAHI